MSSMPAHGGAIPARSEDPRVTRSKAAVLAATIELLREVGLGGLTIEGIAARSGVAKTTIYRHWTGCGELAFESIETMLHTDPASHHGDLRRDLISTLMTILDGLGSAAWAEVLPTMIDAAERDEHVQALAREFAARRRAGLEQRLAAAVHAGELPGDTDVELLASQLVAPLFYRRFISRQSISPGQVERHVDVLLAGTRTSPSLSSPSSPSSPPLSS